MIIIRKIIGLSVITIYLEAQTNLNIKNLIVISLI